MIVYYKIKTEKVERDTFEDSKSKKLVKRIKIFEKKQTRLKNQNK